MIGYKKGRWLERSVPYALQKEEASKLEKQQVAWEEEQQKQALVEEGAESEDHDADAEVIQSLHSS